MTCFYCAESTFAIVTMKESSSLGLNLCERHYNILASSFGDGALHPDSPMDVTYVNKVNNENKP